LIKTQFDLTIVSIDTDKYLSVILSKFNPLLLRDSYMLCHTQDRM